jgi:glycerol-1-phosphate dehydrogenase [NAD(P)+]
LIAAALYKAIRRINIDRIDFKRLAGDYPDWPERERQIVREHGNLAEIVMPEAKAQHLTRDNYRAHLETIRRSWPKIWQYLDDTMLSAEQIRQAYLAAGTPTRAEDLAIPPELVVKAYHLARDIRARYTILHLAGDLGLLDQLAEEVFDASGVLA